MSGAPAAAYSGGEFLVVRLGAVETLGSWEAAAIWHRICWRSQRDGSWVASIATVAEDVMLTEYRTKVALRAIRDAGWITAERAGAYDATLRWVPIWAENAPALTVVFDASEAEDSDVSSLQDQRSTTPPPTSSADDELFVSAPTALAVVPAPSTVDVEFEAWYAVYPRHVARARALKAYRTARKRVSAETILDGLRAQVGGLEARPMDKRPHPTTWLNQERWADDAEHAVPAIVASGGRRNYFAETTLNGRGAELLASLNAEHTAIGGGA